jgi:threonine/homoserine/homoserine lactone efflux protein
MLLFLARLPQFTDRHGSWPVAGQVGLLGLVFTLSCGAFYLALGSATRAVWRSHPALARSVTRLSGVAMAIVGLSLLVDRLIA